ncbi:Rossmann-like domain-containing protein [Clostridium magnum]|uniref:Putative heavy-metal chelation domain-containing protein n=1 Tax=Clostridium magnum DSM 2767 TaxID=1121326 RepID=A0A162SKG3_9CLOT|nr:DUF364 domain-containing protein [Clostridium magnum]KZL91399.1 hypothetical protein CLMAG_31580 [Clostridium magnum DSM 2767]SHH40968.1 Putative heavy-metal chelation [Clostridium magnum DSM 2767]
MSQNQFYTNLFDRFKKLVEDNGLLNEEVKITGRTLTTEEAIGNTERKDFPIIKGKEKLLEADFRGVKGQAFTDMPNNFQGNLKQIVEMSLETNFDTAVYIATLNAVCRYLKITDKTVHCKDGEPENCASELVEYIKNKYGNPKIALIGFQPAMLENLGKNFKVRIVDLDTSNIGKVKYSVMVEDGSKPIDDLLNWCDIVVATGSTIANKTITNLLLDKPTIFFGTTLAGAAALMKLERFCPCSK